MLNDQKPELALLYRTATAEAPRVWHLHGHVSRSDSLILAPAQYEAFYGDTLQTKKDYEAALLQLRSLVANYSLLFAGFSFSDAYVMDLLVGVLDAFGGSLRSSYALLKAGERIFNLERLFLLQAGFTGANDTLPRRMLEEPLPDGPGKGHVADLGQMLPEFYRLRGWDEHGVPTAGKLESLGLGS